jgi:hypothetical protein
MCVPSHPACWLRLCHVNIFPGLDFNHDLLISTSQVAGITGVSHCATYPTRVPTFSKASIQMSPSKVSGSHLANQDNDLGVGDLAGLEVQPA